MGMYSNRHSMGYQLSDKSKYFLSRSAFLEALYFAYQYSEFMDELEALGDGSRGISYDSQPHGSASKGSLEDLAIKRARISARVDIIEQSCRETDPDLYFWLLKGVTSDSVGYDYLRYQLGMPCGRRQYYEKSRQFYYILYCKKLAKGY